METPTPELTLSPVVGTLPAPEAAAGDRTARVVALDLPAASRFDLGPGLHLVSAALSVAAGLPDLVTEHAAATGSAPVRFRFPRPYATLSDRPVRDAYLVSDLDALRRFVDGARFLTGDLVVRAFLHAVVVAHPSAAEPFPPSSVERLWIQSKLTAAGLVPGVAEAADPPGVLLWTVGLESDAGSAILSSGFRASARRSVRHPR